MKLTNCAYATWVSMFQWAPTLGGECYFPELSVALVTRKTCRFNGHPPLGVNATSLHTLNPPHRLSEPFQWAPTLGGECYKTGNREDGFKSCGNKFQWAPTLGGECYLKTRSINWSRIHPTRFQWAPTLGGECYGIVYLITPPLCQGVNALLNNSKRL